MAKRTLTANVRGMCKLLFVVVLAVLGMRGQCGRLPIPNPNRKLFLSKEGDYFLFNPVWHPSGEWIYYLAEPDTGQWQSGSWPSPSGSIWKIKVDGTEDRLVLDGRVRCFVISRDGANLAFFGGPVPSDSMAEKMIVVADTSGTILDTIRTTDGAWVRWVKFSKKDDAKLYYSVRIRRDTIGYFRINLDGSGEELLFACEGRGYFDLFSDDSMYLHPYYSIPSLHPQNESYVVYPVSGDLFLKNLVTGEGDSLYADPYGSSHVESPSWSPDGDRVVYYAGPHRGSMGEIPKLALWMVEDIEPGKSRIRIAKRR